MLVVMEHRDLHALLEPVLDVEAFRRLEVLQIDAAEGRLQRGDHRRPRDRPSCASISMSNTSMPANFLNRTALPSITGLPASGPILPRPSTAVPFDTTATRLARAVSSAACGRIGDDRLAGGRHARRIGERQVALVAERLGRLDLQLSGLRRAVIDQRAGAQIVGYRRGHCHTPVQSGADNMAFVPRGQSATEPPHGQNSCRR